MNFNVCIKQVPDVNAPLRIADGALIQDTGRMVLNAYDASAVEEALVLTEQYGGSVNVILIGPERAKDTVRKALAMGAHTATHIICENPSALDSERIAEILAAYFNTQNDIGVISCGKQSQDTDSGLAGSMLAEHLNLPYATNAVGLDLDQDTLVVTRQGDAGQEIIALPTPCVVTCSNDMNNPRIPSVRGVMLSKKKPYTTLAVADLQNPDAARTNVIAYEPLPQRDPGPQWEDDPATLVENLMTALQNDAVLGTT